MERPSRSIYYLFFRLAILHQDEIGKVRKAPDEGIIMEAIAFVMRLLKKQFGEVPAEISSQIEDLSIEDLESLGEAFLDFNSLEDLSVWLSEEREKNDDLFL